MFQLLFLCPDLKLTNDECKESNKFSSLSGPWSKHICEYFENNKYNVFRYSISIATLLLFLGFFIPGQMFSYGLFGGEC